MSMFLEPNLDVPAGATPPDRYALELGVVPPDDFVVTRARDGSPASLFAEPSWDFSAYNPEGRRTRLYFAYWGNGPENPARRARSIEIRCILFSLIWRREGPSLSVGTLGNYLVVLCALALYAEKTGSTLASVLGDETSLRQFVESGCSGWMAETLGSLLGVLAPMGYVQLGFDIVSDNTIRALKRRNRGYRATLKQHPPIPTRIYSNLILGLQVQLNAWLEVSADMLEALRMCGSDLRMGRTVLQQRAISKREGIPTELLPIFETVVTPASIAYIESKGKACNVKSLSTLVTEAQHIAKLLIQTFTGMRDDEAASLPYSCLETTVVSGKTHYIVKGRTTKLTNGLAKRTRWVTNQDGYRAIQAAQAIADAIYSVFKVTPLAAQERTNDHPLFVSVGYMNLAAKRMVPKGGRFLPGRLELAPDSTLYATLFATIEEADLRELEQIDPHRAWRAEEKFTLGRTWVFTTHQLRRSLALYAQRSGLVSLPSLRRQLQHITEEMSRYYAKGSEFAKDFISGEKDHFGLEWQSTQAESAGLGYLLNVLLSDDMLFGGHASWVKHRLKGPDGVVLVDREVTMKQFKKGELAYRDTLIGGCTNVHTCDKVALRWLHIDCLRDNCRNLVGNLPKLERAIVAQERMVGSLDQESVEYRTEKADLDVLVAAHDSAVQRHKDGRQ